MNGPFRNFDQHQTAKPDSLVVLRERAEAKVLLIQNECQDLQSAVDELWAAAERDGLVKAHGADEIQWLLSEVFGRWRPPSPEFYCDEDELQLDIIRRLLELADPRDRWKWTGEVPPSDIVRNSDISAKPANAPPSYRTPQSTVDAFKFVVGLRDQKRFKAFLADHPLDAPFLLKLLEKVK